MTVSELIELLKAMPQETDIAVLSPSGNVHDILIVSAPRFTDSVLIKLDL
jgi:hypothetical protein